MVPSGVIETPTDAYKATVLPLNYDGKQERYCTFFKKTSDWGSTFNMDGGS